MKSLKTKLLWLLMGALAVSAGTGLYALAMPSSGAFRWDLFQSAMSLAGYTIGWMACARVGAQRRMLWLALPAGVFLVLAYVGVLTLVWNIWTGTGAGGVEDIAEKLTGSATILGVTLAGAGLMSMIKVRLPVTRIIRPTTIVLGALLCAMSLLLLWEVLDFDDPNEIVRRLFSGLLILTSVGVIASIVLSRIEATKLSELAETGLSTRIRVTLTCPRCDLRQELSTGGAVCKGCGLAITIKVAKPVCKACGYSLAGLNGTICPECGVEVPADVLRLAGRARKAE